MDFGIAGKTALVLGGSGGLGRGIAKALAAEGVRVAVAGRKIEALDETCCQIWDQGARCLPLAWDLSVPEQIEPNIARIEAELGPVDILINNTGGPPPTPAQGQDPTLWSAQFQSMVLSVIGVSDRVLPAMKAAGWGRIITSTSSGVEAPIPGLAISNTLRASLVGWSKTLSREIAPYGITANIIVPGRIATDRIRFLDSKRAEAQGRTEEAVRAEATAAIPAGRMGSPEEYGAMVAFLASQQAAYVTGSIIRVDGGMIPSI